MTLTESQSDSVRAIISLMYQLQARTHTHTVEYIYIIIYHISPTCYSDTAPSSWRNLVTCSKLSAHCNVVTLVTEQVIRVVPEDGAVCAETFRRNLINGNVHNLNVVQSKHNNIFNNVKFATCFGYSSHHQADISVHGHDKFSAYSIGSNIVYICCVEFQTFR